MNNGPRQLPFDLPAVPRYGRADFLVGPPNRTAFEMIERWPDWPDRMLLLVGPTGAGKTHLASIWAERAQAKCLPAAALRDAEVPTLVAAPALLIEDAEDATGAEKALFHLVNLVRESQSFLILTARRRPDLWGLATPDLLSRLRLAPVVEIGAPDDALIRDVLVKLFGDRQLIVDRSVVEYLALRIERSIDAARRIVDALDREALALGRAVTRPMAADILRKSDLAQQADLLRRLDPEQD